MAQKKEKNTSKKSADKITKEIVIGDLIKKNPKSTEILMSHGMHCIGCHISTWETLEQAAETHGIDVDKIVNDLNKK